MTARSIIADASKVSGADFARSLGLNIRTPEQKQAEYNAEVERYAAMILRGCEFNSFGNPAVSEAMKRIALREGDAGVVSDPLPKRRVA